MNIVKAKRKNHFLVLKLQVYGDNQDDLNKEIKAAGLLQVLFEFDLKEYRASFYPAENQLLLSKDT